MLPCKCRQPSPTDDQAGRSLNAAAAESDWLDDSGMAQVCQAIPLRANILLRNPATTPQFTDNTPPNFNRLKCHPRLWVGITLSQYFVAVSLVHHPAMQHSVAYAMSFYCIKRPPKLKTIVLKGFFTMKSRHGNCLMIGVLKEHRGQAEKINQTNRKNITEPKKDQPMTPRSLSIQS